MTIGCRCEAKDAEKLFYLFLCVYTCSARRITRAFAEDHAADHPSWQRLWLIKWLVRIVGISYGENHDLLPRYLTVKCMRHGDTDEYMIGLLILNSNVFDNCTREDGELQAPCLGGAVFLFNETPGFPTIQTINFKQDMSLSSLKYFVSLIICKHGDVPKYDHRQNCVTLSCVTSCVSSDVGIGPSEISLPPHGTYTPMFRRQNNNDVRYLCFEARQLLHSSCLDQLPKTSCNYYSYSMLHCYDKVPPW